LPAGRQAGQQGRQAKLRAVLARMHSQRASNKEAHLRLHAPRSSLKAAVRSLLAVCEG
jgi:hypothetical protein